MRLRFRRMRRLTARVCSWYFRRAVRPLSAMARDRFAISQVELISYAEVLFAVAVLLLMGFLALGLYNDPLSFDGFRLLGWDAGGLAVWTLLLIGPRVFVGQRLWRYGRGEEPIVDKRINALRLVRNADWKNLPLLLFVTQLFAFFAAMAGLVSDATFWLYVAVFFYNLVTTFVAGFWRDRSVRRRFVPPRKDDGDQPKP